MMWLLFAGLAAFTWALVNYVDKFIVEKVSENKGVGALVLFSGLAGLPVVLFTSIFFWSEIIAVTPIVAFWVILSGVFYLLYVIGYLYALSKGEVSLIVPQLLLAPIISIFLGYLFLNEVLTIIQLIGSALIVIGAIILTINLETVSVLAKLKVVGYIVLASFFLSLNVVIFKYAVAEESISFWATIFWEHVGFIVFASFCFLAIRKYREDFLKMVSTKGNTVIGTNIISEALTLLGNFAAHYGSILAPVALVQITADGIQPFFILAIGIILSRFFPKITNEDNSFNSLMSKIIATTLMSIGIFLVNH